MKIHLFFATLAGFILFWLAFFRPFEITITSKPQADVLFEQFLFSIIDTQGIRLRLFGKKATKQKYSIKIEGLRLQSDNKKLTAQRGVYEGGNLLHLEGDIRYISARMKFFTQKANYYLRQKLLHIPTQFRLVAPQMEVNGSKMDYYLDLDKIIAYNIKALIKSDL